MNTKTITILVGAAAAATLTQGVAPAEASSHREALAIVNDPCVDHTDLYAWVSPGTHDKLYLIQAYNGLHEPGQGNQQTRLCDDVLYTFHITKGPGLEEAMRFEIELDSTPPTPVDESNLALPPGGGKELLIQISGVVQTYKVTKVLADGTRTVIARDVPVAPPNIGPRTDRFAYGLGTYDAGNLPGPTSNVSLYNAAFMASFIRPMDNGGRTWVGQADDPFYLDEKGIFDLININASNPGNPGKDVFAGFNTNVIALEIPTSDLFGGAVPHNGTCGDDTLIGVWNSASRRKYTVLRASGKDQKYGPWVQVGRQGLPLINAGMIGSQDHTRFLRTTPLTDVANFASYFTQPILVRDVEALGIYAQLGVPQATINTLKDRRFDILRTINLDNIPAMGCHHVPIEPGKTGDVLRLDVATDSQFPNGRSIAGGSTPDREQVDVSDVLITVIVSGGAIPIGDNVNRNDKAYQSTFPFVAVPHIGLTEGHGAIAP